MKLVPRAGRLWIALAFVPLVLVGLWLARGRNGATRPAQPPHAATCTGPSCAQPPRATGSNDRRARIVKVSATEFEVQRSLVDEVLREPRASKCWFVPHEQDDRVVGVEVYGIRTGSLLREIGLQNGDLLRSLNGVELTTAEAGQKAYGELRSARKLVIALERGGHAMTLSYTVK